MKYVNVTVTVCNTVATIGCLSLCVNVAYICVGHYMLCNVAALKCCHHCSVNLLPLCATLLLIQIILLSLCVNIAYVLIIRCDVAANKCHNCYGINVAVTICSEAATICSCYCM